MSGIHPIISDMCPRTHIAYTGPFANLEACIQPDCGLSRIDPTTGKPHQQFYTIPLGLQIQALRRHPDTAKEMLYFRDRMDELLAELEQSGDISSFDDICCGRDILEAYQSGHIKPTDTVLIFSFDGCQLY